MKRWQTKPLEEIAELFGGSTPSRSNPEYWDGDIYWVTPTDLPMPNEGISTVQTSKEKITQLGLDHSSATLVPRDTVLFSSRATIGKVAIAGMPLSTNQGFANLIPNSQVTSRFLAYALWFHREDIARLSGSTTFKEVSRSTLRKFHIPVPPLFEQERIVTLLDEVDKLRKLRAEADRRSSTFIPALFNEMFGDPENSQFGWPICTAGELMESCEYGTSQKANDEGRGVVVLRMSNVKISGELDIEKLKTVELSKGELAKQQLQAGDVLFNRTNSRELVGKTGMWDGRMEAVAASYFIRIRFRSNIEHPQHFTTFMNLPQMKNRLAQLARGSIGQANINSKELQAIKIPVPPLTLQNEFAARVTDARKLHVEQELSGQHIENLFQSIMNDAFNGIL